MSQIISSMTTVLPKHRCLTPCVGSSYIHTWVALDNWVTRYGSTLQTARNDPRLMCYKRHNATSRVPVSSAQPCVVQEERVWTYRPPVTVWMPPCPAWQCPSRCTCAAPSGCGGTAWPRGACSSALLPPPPSPQTSPTWEAEPLVTYL